jgi:hypothetical protein
MFANKTAALLFPFQDLQNLKRAGKAAAFLFFRLYNKCWGQEKSCPNIFCKKDRA